MANRYVPYTRLKLDYPAKRVLRLTFDRPQTHNSVDVLCAARVVEAWGYFHGAEPGFGCGKIDQVPASSPKVAQRRI
jgi:hypothetical protein